LSSQFPFCDDIGTTGLEKGLLSNKEQELIDASQEIRTSFRCCSEIAWTKEVESALAVG
jgi:hypothetical protein